MSFLPSLFDSVFAGFVESLLQLHRKQPAMKIEMIKEFRMREFIISSGDRAIVMKQG